MKKIVIVSISAVLFFSTLAIFAELKHRGEPWTSGSNKYPFDCPFCSSMAENSSVGSVVDIFEPPKGVKHPGITPIKEYKGKPFIAYSAVYKLPGLEGRYPGYREVCLICTKNNVPTKCCATRSIVGYTDETHRATLRNTGITCREGETLELDWILNDSYDAGKVIVTEKIER
jgi:hypothetical protein